MERIFNYRNSWMGIATLWIIWFHSRLGVPIELLTYVKAIGYGGVDIFVFASGIGCYYSLAKNADVVEFIKRRFWRIFPTYWCFMSVWLVYKVITAEIPFSAIVGNLFCVQSITGLGNGFNWYMGLLCIMYLLAPFFFGILKRIRSLRIHGIVIGLMLLFSCAFWCVDDMIIVVTRLPIFYVGMYFAQKAKEEKMSSNEIKAWGILAILGFVLMYGFMKCDANILWAYGLYWYPFLLIVPGSCIMLSFFMEKCNGYRIGRCLNKSLSYVGRYSFEVYLIEIFVFEVYNYLVKNGMMEDRIRYQLCFMVLIIPMSAILNMCTNRVMKLINRKNKGEQKNA